jgi:hypothetical protein
MKKQGSLLPQFANPWPWIGVSAVVVGVGLVLHTQRALSGLLVAGLFGVQLTVGALFWVAMLTVSGAKWWHPVREHFLAVSERIALPAIVAAGAAIAGMGQLYSWAAPGAADHSHLLHAKAAWLNRPFFSVRAIVVVVVWLALAAVLSRAMRKWMGGARKSVSKVTQVASLTIVLGALTISLAFWDWAMSMEPEWFSTMYGVYGFSGALQGGIAVVTLVAIYQSRRGDSRINAEVRHDFGRLLFGFSFFWGYIWFCQFMLIWYANLPEEIGHYARRMSPGWGSLFWMNVVLNFGVPFFLLLPAKAKRHEGWLMQVAMLVVAVRLIDVYLLVEPSLLVGPAVPIYHAAAVVLLLVGTLVLAHQSRASKTRPSTRRKTVPTS